MYSTIKPNWPNLIGFTLQYMLGTPGIHNISRNLQKLFQCDAQHTTAVAVDIGCMNNTLLECVLSVGPK